MADYEYSVIDLGYLEDPPFSYMRPATVAYDINNSGQIVGWSSVYPGTERNHGFLWQDGAMTDLCGDMCGNSNQYVYAINDLGHAIGHSYELDGPFIWANGTITHMENTSSSVMPFGINNSGQVVGLDPQEGAKYESVLWENGVTQKTGDLGVGISNPCTGLMCPDIHINDSGQIVGSSGHAFLWDKGVITDLGSLGGTSYAMDMNDSGQVVGYSFTEETSQAAQHAFLWQNGQMIDLGTLGGDWSMAAGINNSGQVVGISDIAHGSYGYHPFLWEDGEMIDLVDAFPEEFNDIISLMGINDFGSIIGTYGNTGNARSFLMTVVPEPASCLLMLVGGAGLVVYRRSR